MNKMGADMRIDHRTEYLWVYDGKWVSLIWVSTTMWSIDRGRKGKTA